MRMPRDERHIRWLLLLVSLAVLTAGLGVRQPWPADEPRFALVAHEMVITGQWLIPHVAGVPYPDKPPLVMWMMAAGMQLGLPLGVWFLLPSLLAGVGTLFLTYDLGRRLWSPRIAAWAVLLLLATFQFTNQVRSAQLDAPVMFWITLSLYAQMRYLLLDGGKGWAWLAGIAAGLGVLTKGVGIIALFMLLPACWARWRGDWPTLSPERALGMWRIAVGFLVAVSTWGLPMIWHTSASGDAALLAYRDDILLQQTATRYAAAWHHLKPWWYYLATTIPVLWMPLALCLPWVWTGLRRRLARHDARQLLLLGSVIMMFLFFQISPGKRGVYLLPLLPPLALALAPLLPGLVRRSALPRVLWAAMVCVIFGCALALTSMTMWDPARGQELAARMGVQPWTMLWMGAAVSAFILLVGWRRPLEAFGSSMLWAWVFSGWIAAPVLDDARSGAGLMMRVETALPSSHTELGLVDWEEQFILQASRPVSHFGYRRRAARDEVEDGVSWLLAKPNRVLLLPAGAAGPCVQPQEATRIGFQNRREWLLIDADAIDPRCSEVLRLRDPRTYRTETRAGDRSGLTVG